jgi:1-acyl-sn-glycerol-3-phosphate acyltransferase
MRAVVLPILIRRYGVSAAGDLQSLAAIALPYVMVANHVNFWDPFWINAFVRHPVQFVTSDNVFRGVFFGIAMKLFGSIPKTKLMNDSRTVRHIFEVLGRGGVIGIFPEGSRSYDGRSSPVIPAVARLIRKLNVLVISATIRGGYLSRPRWARHVRRGKVLIEFELLFAAGDLLRMTDGEILTALAHRMSFDEMAWQRQQGVPFRGRRPAEYLERLLFICPSCSAVSRLASRNDILTCTACAYAVRVNQLGRFEPLRGPLHFADPAEWNAWQLPVLDGMLSARSRLQEPFFVEQQTRLLHGYRDLPLLGLGAGSAALMRDRLVFRGQEGEQLTFLHSRIQGMNVQNREMLEFYYDNALYRLDFRNPRASPYAWTKTMELLAGSASQARSLIRVNTY